jgi:hypothetical protein
MWITIATTTRAVDQASPDPDVPTEPGRAVEKHYTNTNSY